MSAERSEVITELTGLAKRALKDAGELAQPSGLAVVAFFDLSGSSAAKLTSGVPAAVRDALAFTGLAASIAARCNGRVLKTLGDGALAVFEDPIDACRAALELRFATHELLQLRMTAGLTSGAPLRMTLDGRLDVLGDVVDRAARIQSQALPGQVLVDATLRSQIRGFVAGVTDWQLDDEPRRAYAKGIGTIDLYELCWPAHWTLRRELATPFNFISSGRPSLAEKLALIRDAKVEIIEIGIGLTSFAQYFTGQKPEEFRDPVRRLLRLGVDLACYALDPSYGPGVAWLAEQGNADYPQEAALARRRLEAEAKHCRRENYSGSLTYSTYDRVPEFWCLGVDVDDPLTGRMFFAPYLMGVARSATPVLQVSRTSNPELYDKYLQSVHEVRQHASRRGGLPD